MQTSVGHRHTFFHFERSAVKIEVFHLMQKLCYIRWDAIAKSANLKFLTSALIMELSRFTTVPNNLIRWVNYGFVSKHKF